MANMFNTLGLAGVPKEGLFGVEIEVEGANLPRNRESVAFDAVWRVEKDGSLRGESAEYVFRKPLSFEQARDAIILLGDRRNDKGSVINESVRAGVHVHLNVQALTPLQLMTLATTYYMLEDFFTHWAGETRVGNHFCLRATDAEEVIYKVIKVCETKDWGHIHTDAIRYASLNWNALHKYGSIEFRAMRSTNNLNAIIKWVDLINSLLEGSKKFDNPRDVVNLVSEFRSTARFIKFIMGDNAKEFIPFIDKINIWEALENVQPISYMIDWAKFAKEKVNPFKKG